MDEDRLPAAEPGRVSLGGRGEAELFDVMPTVPELTLEQHHVPLDSEAGLVERSLRVHAVDQRGDELDVGLRLQETTHDAERTQQPPVP